jgi:hypothetical protein
VQTKQTIATSPSFLFSLSHLVSSLNSLSLSAGQYESTSECRVCAKEREIEIIKSLTFYDGTAEQEQIQKPQRGIEQIQPQRVVSQP